MAPLVLTITYRCQYRYHYGERRSEHSIRPTGGQRAGHGLAWLHGSDAARRGDGNEGLCNGCECTDVLGRTDRREYGSLSRFLQRRGKGSRITIFQLIQVNHYEKAQDASYGVRQADEHAGSEETRPQET